MIFITVGTEKFPFDRLLRAIEEAVRRGQIKDEVFAQIGNCCYEPVLFKWQRFIDFDQQAELIKKSDIVVSHAGEGSVFLCLSLGKVPVFFPRQAAFKEHLDNHQMEFAKKMASRGKVLAAFNEEELIEKIKNYKALAGQLSPLQDDAGRKKLIAYLRQIAVPLA